MIISNTKKTKPKNKDNIQNIIEGGELKFKSIYNNLKNNLKEELVSKLISRLFTTLEKQKKQIEEYKQEISALKNNLVYLLKRILLTNNKEKKNLTSNFHRMQNYEKLTKNYSMTTNNTTYNSFSPKNQSSSSLKLFTSFYKNSEITNDYNLTYKHEAHFPFNQPQSELDIKVNNYINSLYMKNFCKNETNINDYYSLNKTQTVYEVVMEKTRKKCHNKSFSSSYNKNNNSKKDISISRKKRRYSGLNKNKKISDSNPTINSFNYEEINNSNADVRNNNYLKVKKKNSESNFNNKRQLNYCNSVKNFSKISKGNGNSKKNNNMGLKKKINRPNHLILMNRSPFLINKV